MENKLVINEEELFNIEIKEWNKFTLGVLKSYSDWKCNGEQVPVAPLVDVPVIIEEQLESSIIDPRDHKFGPPLFTEKEVVCKKSKYGNISIYQPMLDYLLKHLSKEFTRQELKNLILNFYASKGRKITVGSAQVYSCSYRRYMIDSNLIKAVGDNFEVIKKNQS